MKQDWTGIMNQHGKMRSLSVLVITFAVITVVFATVPVAFGSVVENSGIVNDSENSFVEQAKFYAAIWEIGADEALQSISIMDEDPLVRDAYLYAADQGISLSEALRRLRLQDLIGKLNTDLEINEQDTFAGLWIQHKPDYRVVVQFTRDGEQTIQRYIQNGPLAGIIEVRQAEVAWAELVALQEQAARAVNKLGIPVASDINMENNRVELYTKNPAQLREALQKEGLRLSESVVIIGTTEAAATLDGTILFGGLALTTDPEGMAGTSGFSVRNANGTKGITTAGHCADKQTYGSTVLPFQGEQRGGSCDVQWHTGAAGDDVQLDI